MKNSSMTVRKTIGREVPLFYPNFSGIIIIYAHAGKMQLGRVIGGKGISIAFYS